MIPKQTFRVLALICVLGMALLAVPASADVVEKTFPFKLDEWFDIDYEDGPLAIHRVRVKTMKGNFKSKVFRPGVDKDPMLQDVQVQVEYSNDMSRDIEAHLEIFWVDSKGRRIDGYDGTEDMDEEERHELMTSIRSTLVYGLDVAKKLKVKITF